MKTSVVINCDTRPSNDTAEKMFSGCCNEDFLADGVINKIKFFEGFDIEVILFIDKHADISSETLAKISELADTLVIRKHTHENGFNDYNYLKALQLANGEIIAHFDQDTAAFTSDPKYVQHLIDLTEQHAFVSYPSYWSPKPVHDESFGNRTWASTRFFICKKEYIKFDELYNCIKEPNWGYEKYGDSPRRCNWLEHFLTLTSNDDCYYPPLDVPNYTIFSWDRYTKGTLQMLNNLPYKEVEQYIYDCGSLHYPVDLTAK